MLRYLPLLLALFCWSWPPVIARWLGLEGIDVYTQNLVRVAAAAIVFIPLGFCLRPAGMRDALRRWRRFVLPALFLAIAQTCWYFGLLKVGATFSALLGRMDILFTVLVGVAFFEDERSVVLQRGFIPALIVTLLGVVGVVVLREGAAGNVETHGMGFVLGVTFTILSSVFWVAYVYAVKLVVVGTGAVVTMVALNAVTVVFLALIWAGTVVAGLAAPSALLRADGWRVGAVVLSGLVGMGGGFFYIRSIDDVGATISQCGVLALPLMVGTLAYMWLHERLAVGQVLSGGVLLAGLLGIVYLEYRSRRARSALERDLTCTATFR